MAWILYELLVTHWSDDELHIYEMQYESSLNPRMDFRLDTLYQETNMLANELAANRSESHYLSSCQTLQSFSETCSMHCPQGTPQNNENPSYTSTVRKAQIRSRIVLDLGFGFNCSASCSSLSIASKYTAGLKSISFGATILVLNQS